MEGSLARKTDLTGSLAEENASARRVTAKWADPCGKISCKKNKKRRKGRKKRRKQGRESERKALLNTVQ